MSATLLTRVKNYLDANSLISGYAVKYFRWTDADTNGNTPFILFRQSGNGASSVLLQDTQVSIIIVDTPTGAVSADTRAQAILRLLRQPNATSGVVRFDPIGTVIGPSYLDNGRPVFEIVVSAYTEDL